MFTGLISDLGTIASIHRGSSACTFSIRTRLTPRLQAGGSLAVDGACLTLTGEPVEDRVELTAVAETLQRTTLGRRRVGDRVHLEPALCAGEPLGGHWVQGHIDGIATLRQRAQQGDQRVVGFDVDRALCRYIVAKGSVALDGVSLTVVDARDAGFSVVLIPHTLDQTLLGERRVGDHLNLEVDILAKYVERLLERRTGSAAGLSEKALRERGF